MNGLEIQQTTKIKKPTQEQIALAFGIDERTVRRWNKPQSAVIKLERKLKLKGVSQAILRFGMCSGKTQQEMADYIFQKTGQKVNQSTISRTLKRFNITRKKVNYHYADQLKHVDKIESFIEKVPILSNSPVLAIDECSFHLNEVPRYAYAMKGFRANSRKPGGKGENHTLILCVQNVNGKGVVKWKLIKGGMKSKDFHEFISDLNLPTNQKFYLLLDNLKVHHATKSCIKLKLSTIKELLTSKNIIPIYLPPYTPELNPVELIFNFLRNNTENKKPRTTEELQASISKAIELLQQKDLTEYFRHCWEYFDENKENNGKRVKIRNRFSWHQLSREMKLWWRYIRIYPSQKWKRLGEYPTKQNVISAYKRIKRCVLRSLQLANPKSVKLSI